MRTGMRKLDRLVAEKVMGWTYDDTTFTEDCPLYVTEVTPASTSTIFADDFSPSTDIAAAWRVVEKCVNDGWFFEMTADCPSKGRWEAWLGNGKVSADTAPLAICLAALQAAGVEVPRATEEETKA